MVDGLPTSAVSTGRAGIVRDEPAAHADQLVDRLFKQEARSLVRLARLFCDDRSSAEDLVQEAFIRLHRSAHTIREPERAPAFLRSIVLNLARDHNRRGLMSLRHQNADRTHETSADPEEDAIADGDDRLVIEAVRSLPARQRECLVLRFYAQMTEREIAETVGISPNSVKTHCQRGLRSLESRLEDPR
ncbi:MAG: sigma-70 family RNA polymerase sigma factor [Acidimicrobiia bacterium]|nr:sigma-70 family RNA polymerase sigma factor [Acidimicrobiia bacterium]